MLVERTYVDRDLGFVDGEPVDLATFEDFMEYVATCRHHVIVSSVADLTILVHAKTRVQAMMVYATCLAIEEVCEESE